MNNSDHKITVVTVSFNAVATIEETIRSVVDLTYPNVEYLIIDGGSTDGTVDIIRKYAEGGYEAGRHRHTVAHWLSEPDYGIYDAMNKSINLATGDFLYFLGADDLLEKDAFCFFSKNNKIRESVIYGDIKLKNSGRIVKGKTNNWKILSHNIPHQSIFYKIEVLKKYKYDINYRTYADYILNLQCWRDKAIRFLYIDQVIAVYNESGASSSGQDALFEKNVLSIMMAYACWYLKPMILLKKIAGKLVRGKYKGNKG